MERFNPDQNQNPVEQVSAELELQPQGELAQAELSPLQELPPDIIKQVERIKMDVMTVGKKLERKVPKLAKKLKRGLMTTGIVLFYLLAQRRSDPHEQAMAILDKQDNRPQIAATAETSDPTFDYTELVKETGNASVQEYLKARTNIDAAYGDQA